MNMRADKVEVEIEELREAGLSTDQSAVVLETTAVVNGRRSDASIEVAQEDVPAVAVALLNTDAAPAPSDLPPAVRCLGAGVVHGADSEDVRFHLQFDSGQVLPIEISREAALALGRGLFHAAGGTGPFDGAGHVSLVGAPPKA